jgi:hypothetical protein
VKKEHVAAAADLLQKSIVQLERDDIELEEDDEANPVEPVDETEPTAAVDDGDVEMVQADVPHNALMASGPAQPVEPQKKMIITADEYEAITRNVLVWLKEHNERSHLTRLRERLDRQDAEPADPSQTIDTAEQEDEETVGLSLSALTEMYLENVEDRMHSEDDLDLEKRKFTKVIRAMIKKDHTLIPYYATMDDGALMEGRDQRLMEDTMLAIHPYFDLDSLQ